MLLKANKKIIKLLKLYLMSMKQINNMSKLKSQKLFKKLNYNIVFNYDFNNIKLLFIIISIIKFI